jgi:hypothetical protein
MGVIDSGTLHHTCFVVNDLEKSAQELADSLAMKWNIWTIEPVDTTIRGQRTPFSFRVAIGQVGDSNYELIQPLSEHSHYSEHLRTNGEGFHHTCLAYPSREAMRAAKNELVKQGREMIASASLGELGEFCYFDVPGAGGALELLYLKELPPPLKTIG